MLIASKFRDYYDSALGLGIDKTIVYKRETEKLELGGKRLQAINYYQPVRQMDDPHRYVKLLQAYPTHWAEYRWRPSRWEKGDFECIPFIIGFCGKIYPAFEFRRSCVKDEYIFSMDEVNERVTADWFREKPWKFASANVFRLETCEKFFARDHAADFAELFHLYKVPVFCLTMGFHDPVVLTLNPCLKDFGFVRVVDPYTAFQEIMMYIPGVLGVGEPITVDVSDKTMAVKRGFDDKSFKTLSPGKKHKRRNG